MDLEKVRAAMAAYKPQAPEITATWGPLNNQLARHRSDIAELLRSLDGAPAIPSSWERLAQLQHELGSTTSEVLALVQGGPLRDREPEGGIYALADALIGEVATDLGRPWAGITLPGEREMVTPRSSIIHLTFPQVSVWDLPIVLHEYGHAVASEIHDDLGSPFQRLYNAADSAVESAHLAELFADAFASYACGPAFACTLVVLRFDPTEQEATRDLPTHPSHDRRVALVLRVLEEQGREIDDAAWTELVEELREAWRSTLRVARPAIADAVPAAAAADGVGNSVSQLLSILELVPAVSYRSWERTKRLASQLTVPPPDGSVSLEEGVTLRDGLNAAWLARLRSPKEGSEIGRRAERLMRSIANRRLRGGTAPGGGHGGGVF
ncbi:MAG TPA: hypothetical protein VOA80_05415 [Thermoanaerobaculia bacterium]|nr:hypothetical protein [Thermoanaerobaculia bacterium]